MSSENDEKRIRKDVTSKEVAEKENDKEEIEKNETQIEEKKEEVKENAKTSLEKSKSKKMTKEEFIESTIQKRKKNTKILIISLSTIIILLFLSIIFAILNVNKTTFINGITVNNLKISGMTKDEAKTKIDELIENEEQRKIILTYNDNEIANFTSKDMEFTYNIYDKLNELYEIGRNGNIFQNNFNIICTAIKKVNSEFEYTYNEEYLKNIIDALDSNVEGLVINPTYYIEENELIIVPGTDGIIIEKEKLKNIIVDKIKNQLIEEENDDIKIEIPIADKKADPIDIDKIYSDIHCEPKDAYYNPDPFELYLDEDGIDFAITIEEAKEIIKESAEEYSIPLKITKANVTINDIDSSAFRYKISTFSTNYDPGYTSRVTNLNLAAGKINGKVLKPGQEFSFNEVVGKRTVEAGYRDAKIFVNGEVVDGTGGGICQVSTTLYNAVLLANLQITDRRNHNYTTSYIKPGRDATVVYGSTDFKFKNTRKYPIRLESSVSGGVITFTVYGVQEENEYDIKIIPVVTETIPTSTQYVNDPSLPSGSEVVKQGGTTGCKVTTYKETYLNGVLQSKEVISNDIYKAMARIVRRGTAAVQTSAPVAPEPTPEPTPAPVPEPVPAPEPIPDETSISE